MADLVLDWGLFGAYGTDFGPTQTVDTGGVSVTVDFNAEDPGAQAFTYNAGGFVGSGEAFDPNSFLKLSDDGNAGGLTGPADTSTTTLSFSATDDQFGNEVRNVSFRINDIDIGRNDPGDESPNHLDIIVIRAYDANGTLVPVAITPGADNVAFGTSGVEGGADAWLPTDGQASSLVSIPGPVARIEIEYDNGEDGAQRVTISDVHFSTTNATGPDYIVEGDEGDNLIDFNYVGDPEGDLIDHNDNAPGRPPQQDTVHANGGNDTVYAGEGDDDVNGGTGDDELHGEAGDDTLIGEEGADRLLGGGGSDRAFGGDGDDTLLGGLGADYLDGGVDDDSIMGGEDDDTIVGGEGADTIYGESGRDVIIGGNVGDFVDGGSAPDGINPADGLPFDYDTLDLRGSAPTDGSLTIEYTSADQEDGIVHFLDSTGAEIGTMEFHDIENVVPCFTPGTAIATPKGERLVEELKLGDKIITRDNGIQEIRWLGKRTLTGFELTRAPHLRPILIQKGALGDNLPEHDILVSPQHRLLMTGDKAQLYFEEREVFAAAKHLIDLPGVDEVGTLGVTYLHFMFDQHEVVLSNGAWSESFQPGASVLNGLGSGQRDEIFELFPELKTVEGVDNYSAARRSLKKHEARLLVR